jgi:hypothetical protein
MFQGRVGDVPMWREKGSSLFILGSDHDFLLQGAARLAEAVRGGVPNSRAVYDEFPVVRRKGQPHQKQMLKVSSSC